MIYSSAILGGNIPGPQGPIGSTGPMGATGNPGVSGSTGPTGEYGKYVVFSQAEPGKITFIYSDGTTGSVIGNFYGATGEFGTTAPVNTLTPVGNYTSILTDSPESGKIDIKGISALGSLVTTIDNNNLYIDTIYDETAGDLDSPGLAADTLMYLKQTDLASSTDIKISAYTEGKVANLDFRNNNFLNDSAVIKTVGPVKQGQLVGIYGELENFGQGTTQGIYVKLQDSGFYIVKTPIGIAGFTGDFRTNEVLTATLVIESDQIWKFPENVYFEPGENYLTCGKSIVNILTFDGGINWYATISQRGLDLQTVSTCEAAINTGSCCYIEYPSNQTKCKEYVTKDVCDKLSGVFKPLQSCTDTCFTNPGVCCTSGKCLENVSITECEQFGGQFYSDTTCSTYPNNPEGDNYAEPISNGRFCFDPCKDQVSCCKDGVCLGNNYSRIQCEQVLGGVAVPGTSCVGNKLCCDININGACCLCDSSTGQNTGCVDGVSKYYCDNYGSITGNINIKGTFVGEGESCSQFNCSCICPQEPLVGCCFLSPEPDPTQNGYCPPGDCGYSFSCFDVARQWCIDQGGTPHPQGTKCELEPGSDPALGAAKRCFCEKFAGPQTRCCNSASHTEDDNCVITDPCTCQELGGISGPYGSVCSPNACGTAPPNSYICCIQNPAFGNVCVQTDTQQECINQGGTVIGEGSCADVVCDDPPPETVACCKNGQCTNKTPEECVASGGVSSPAGTSCATYNCETPTRTCCFTNPIDGDVTCQDLPPELCTQQGGVVGSNGSSCANNPCQGPTEFVACFWCFPDVRENNPYRAGQQYNPNVPGLNLNETQQGQWTNNEQFTSWAAHNLHASQAPYRSAILVTPEKKRLLDQSIAGITVEWGGIQGPGLSFDYPMSQVKPIAEMVYDNERGYHYLENFSSLPWLTENDYRKKSGNVDNVKNKAMKQVYGSIGGNIISAGGTFYCSYVGAYPKNQNNTITKKMCVNRFGYTGDYASIATICDDVVDDEGIIPSEIPPVWGYAANQYELSLGFNKIEPYQNTIKSGIYAPFPPIWGRLTYTNQLETCSAITKKWGSINLNILPQDEVLSMITSFKGGTTGPQWWKNYWNKIKSNKFNFYDKATQQLNKQLGISGNQPYRNLWNKNIYGNPATCNALIPSASSGPGICSCSKHPYYFNCEQTCFSSYSFGNILYHQPLTFVQYDPAQISSLANVYNFKNEVFNSWYWGINQGSGSSCFYYGSTIADTETETDENEFSTAFADYRIFNTGLGWSQIQANGTVLYATNLSGLNWNETEYSLDIQDAIDRGGFDTWKSHWSTSGSNSIYPPENILENYIREIYYKNISDIPIETILLNQCDPLNNLCEFGTARGILGRNLRYNMNKFPTAGVFFEKSNLYTGQNIWKDSSFMYYHRTSPNCIEGGNTRSPGSMSVTVPIFGYYWSWTPTCHQNCDFMIPCTITPAPNNPGPPPCTYHGWSKITECGPAIGWECGCGGPGAHVCNCSTASSRPENDENGGWQYGQCSFEDGYTSNLCRFISWSYDCCVAIDGDLKCTIVDPCVDSNSNFTSNSTSNSNSFAGGGATFVVEYSLHYPKNVGIIQSSNCFAGLLNQNTKRVLLEDGSCVEMVCPECNNYPTCSQ